MTHSECFIISIDFLINRIPRKKFPTRPEGESETIAHFKSPEEVPLY